MNPTTKETSMTTAVQKLDALAELKLSHPTRLRIAMHLLDHTDASPNEMTKALGNGHTLGAVAYHVRALHADQLIQLKRETRVRGAVEHHYGLSTAGRRKINTALAVGE
jgi:predicted ArsR family transcriptional regulator